VDSGTTLALRVDVGWLFPVMIEALAMLGRNLCPHIRRSGGTPLPLTHVEYAKPGAKVPQNLGERQELSDTNLPSSNLAGR
jgi:hypothetical protein